MPPVNVNPPLRAKTVVGLGGCFDPPFHPRSVQNGGAAKKANSVIRLGADRCSSRTGRTRRHVLRLPRHDIAVATLQRWLHTPQDSQDHRRGQMIEVPISVRVCG